MKDKKLNFKEFLQENGVDTKLFAKNCLKENQGINFKSADHSNVYELEHSRSPKHWIVCAFAWSEALQQENPFGYIDAVWDYLINSTKSSNITFGFVKYSLGAIYER